MWSSKLVVLTIYLSSVNKLCASDPTDNCRVVEGDLEYDLSDLSWSDYWHSTETLHTEHTKEYFISVCHPLRNAPTSCPGGNSAVCAVTIQDGDNATRVFHDMGKVPTEIKVADTGRLEYVYKSGQKCDRRGRDETYVTEVHLICSQGTDESMGPVLMSSPGCSLFFAWMTKAACPKKLEMANATTCMVKFSNSDYTLNLHTLHSLSYYNLSTPDESYEVNICGPVTNGHCGQDDATVCQLDKASTPTVMGTTKEMKLVWSNEHLKLLYSYDSKVVEFQFFCERTATLPEIYFVGKNSSAVVFTVKTSVVCTPETPDCVINDDKGNIYDLRPLYKPHGNWKVIDSRRDERVLYHINMCGEVNDEAFYHCPPGPIGACQTSIGASSAYNMGFLTSHPTVNADGSITVLYTGGDVCKNGQHSRSTRINLFCNQRELEPVLIDVTETCEYIFNWLTPAACPRHLKTGSDCRVTDPLYGHEFDFNSLRNKNNDYNVSDGIHSYLINVCGPLLSKCNGEDTSGVCQVKGTEQFSGGLASSNLTFNDGTMIMRFVNGTQGCEDGNKRSTQIVFMCDHEESGFDGPVFIQEEPCTYHFIWRTRVACPPFQVVDCTYFTENGTVYDLSELSTSLVNEEYYSPNHSKKFVLNVCRSIVHSKESRCPYKSAACIVDLDKENHAVSIGEVSSGPTIEKGSLLLKYPRGDQCKSDPSILTETIITFKCDMNALYPYPQLIAEENCKYIFEWATPVACPVNEASGIHGGEDCKVTNPVTGYVFDLSPLKKDNGYDVQGDGGIPIVLNVCDYVKSGKCPGENTGACFIYKNGRLASAGEANANLHYLPGFLFLHYDGGSRCRNGLERATLINFVCGAEGSAEGPVLVDDDLDNCTYHINWHTELACERRINCYVDTWDRRIDLSPLIKTSGNYETLNPYNRKQKFYLNVCRPLNQITGLLCHPGSAACLADAANSDPPLNLGHPMVTPINTNDEVVELMYSSGSVCQTNPGFPITTRISFICDEKVGMGTPVFKEITHDCQYIFEWKTSVVCNKSEEIPDSGPVCQIMYKAAKTNVDLKPLQKSGGYEVKHGNKLFKVNVCGPACSESSVCTTSNETYGSYKKSTLSWDFDKLKLSYFGGDSCSGALTGQKSSVIFFSCDMTAGFGVPVADDIMDMTQCKAVFTWKTNVTCIEGIYKTDAPNTVAPPVILPSSSTESNKTDAGKGSSENNSSVVPSADTQKKEEEPSHTDVTGVIATILVVSGIIFVIVLVLFKSERGQRVLSSARRLIGMKGYTDITQRPAESSSLIGSTSRVFRVDDSDDDLLRV
ncbi:cation-independent mannose-6-phosphate receptor isoform X2 [Palaemon carinicauda]|uniref:cation-independent mannose-6-phosphate receptor isoform X2 n=1 Tax=Palaemon carinicauda TaxID=392227 RepID=UPI0035B5A614